MSNQKRDMLIQGMTITTSEKGNSMLPRIKSGQDHVLAPTTIDDVEINDIVFCKVKGRYYTHLVTAKNEQRGLQISNNHGYVNGWTKQVYGKVIEIL